MRYRTHLFLTLICLALWLPPALPPLTMREQTAHTPHSSTIPPSSASALIPLPRSCGGGLPPGANVPVCCMFGYVFIGGQAVAGAKVTITSPHGSVEVWTEQGPDSPQPYYRTSLSDPPLSAQAGESITTVAEYSEGHTSSVSHVVLGGGQQVDVVLPRNRADDYVYERQIWQPGPAGNFNFPDSIAADGSNTVYVTDRNNARVQVFNSSGQLLRQWGTLGNQPGQFYSPMGIAVDQAGNVYVVDAVNQRIQKFTSTGTWLGSWGSFGSGNGQLWAPEGVAVDTNGNVYVADTANHRIQKFHSDGTFVTKWGSQGSSDGQFAYPTGVAVDSSGNAYVADRFNHRIQKFTNTGSFLAKWGSFGSSDGQFDNPVRVAVDRFGDIYVTDVNNSRIQKFHSDGTFVTKWGSQGSSNGQFDVPLGVAIDSDGNVYVTDENNQRVQKFRTTGDYLTSWGTLGSGRFKFPTGVAVDRNDNLYIADSGYHRIHKYTSTGVYLEAWGGLGAGDGQFNTPGELAADNAGSIYVADTSNHRIQKFHSDGTFVTKWGNFGNGNGQFKFPEGVATDDSGNVYVADTGNHRIQKFTGTGMYLEAWGGLGAGDGQFNSPVSMAVDGNTSVYVTDRNNTRIQKFHSGGTFVTKWSSWNGGQFDDPKGIAVDGSGNVYVADTFQVVKFTSTGSWLTTWGANDLVAVTLDSGGNVYVANYGNDRIQIFRPLTYTVPIATIVAATPRSVIQGQPVELLGMGSDSDETPEIATYEWTLDNNPTPFATTPAVSLPTTGLALGRHIVTFRVRDTESQYSDPQTVSIDVSTAQQPENWTFLLYLDGDNSLIAPFLDRNTPLGALYRLEHSLPNPNVTVLALYDGDLPGGGDTFRYRFLPNGQLSQEALGEVNMGDPQTLIDFVRWGKQQAPAAHYYLAIADHANALDGIAWDFTTARSERLTNSEIRQALVTITENGAQPIDIVHFDGCLMGLIENAYQVRNLARYLVASENLGWSAFAYEVYRTAVRDTTSPAALASVIADRYAARVGEAQYPYTIAALDLGQLNRVVLKTDALAGELVRYALASAANRATLLNLRAQVQKFDSSANLAITNEDEYVDLDDWARLVQSGVSDGGVKTAATALRSILPAFIIREHHASGSVYGVEVNLNRAQGVGIYYPPRASVTTYQTYRNELTFAVDTRWDEYLAAGLAALPFDPSEPPPNPVPPLPLGRRVLLPIVRR
jgi:hypothetical protein